MIAEFLEGSVRAMAAGPLNRLPDGDCTKQPFSGGLVVDVITRFVADQRQRRGTPSLIQAFCRKEAD